MDNLQQLYDQKSGGIKMQVNKALKMAKKTLTKWGTADDKLACAIVQTVRAIDEALEQPAQEPVALIFPENRWYIPSPLDKDEKQIEFNRGFAQGFNDCILHVKLHNQKPLYTHPAPSWQGLSNDRIREIGDNCLENNNGLFNWIEFARAIEQALKEKNL